MGRELEAIRVKRAGCLILRRANRTKTVVGLYKNSEAGLDQDAGNYSTVCEEHSTVIVHETMGLAQRHLSYPDEWCEDCREATKGKRRG